MNGVYERMPQILHLNFSEGLNLEESKLNVPGQVGIHQLSTMTRIITMMTLRALARRCCRVANGVERSENLENAVLYETSGRYQQERR